MLSKTTEYALRATVYLAKGNNRHNTTSQLIAAATHVPEGYMSKVLNTLTRHGIVTSQRGPTGGFTLIESPDTLTILDIVQAVEPLPHIKNCPLKLAEHCEHLCPLHSFLAELVQVVEAKLASTTVADLLNQPEPALGTLSPCTFPPEHPSSAQSQSAQPEAAPPPESTTDSED